MKVNLEDVRFELGASTISKRGNVITIRKSFFYKHGFTTEMLEAKVLAKFPGATIVDSGEIWKAFRGGATIAQQSHWFVKFELPTHQHIGDTNHDHTGIDCKACK